MEMQVMVLRKPGHSSDDLFRSRMEVMIDMDHALVKLAGLIEWSRFDVAFGRFYTQKRFRAPPAHRGPDAVEHCLS
jgi:hypothetical protein